MKLKNIIRITGKIELKTGLHIGGGDTSMRIGGADSTVVKHPVTKQPYIPGSSLKGKIRSLLEWRTGEVQEAPLSWKDYENSQNPQVLNILKLFGVSGDASADVGKGLGGPTRVSFADCMMNQEFAERVKFDFCEIKSENSINRISGTAANPRFFERVPAGSLFDFEVTLRCFDGDDDAMTNLLLDGMRLLELDSLGASGSRGYGKIKFTELRLNDEEIQEKFDAIAPFKAA
ncbi:type III-A CRISPR-associated RAMP protein Csm3 [Luteithermobacter gelatinilyticus]|uniref:type III-A CRISPR-associated RAMP protein Csm3 n=1 Tax=Luteithermobacter gelatinilyticus TaxID=2582913 RepID=UPI0011067DEB|nr:type III-A CRISPR-associated RAMP protein Csm3 [Luteithermobacter gelatinilyticus]